jgi:hypothetical protein
VYIEILEDGVTLSQSVRRAGDLVAVTDFVPQSKSAQVERWGSPRYKQVSQKEFNDRGGNPEEGLSGAFVVPGEGTSEPVGEFDVLSDSNIVDTLSAVASFDDETVARFVVWEKAGANRKGVLEPLGAWTEES